MNATPIVFTASLPDILSAISFAGSGDGARIKLDVPASATDAVVRLQREGSGRPLLVTIEVLPMMPRDVTPLTRGENDEYGDMS